MLDGRSSGVAFTPLRSDTLGVMADEPDPNDALEGDLGTVTDEEWRTAHETLAVTVDWPDSELAYEWSPEGSHRGRRG